eukprot:g6344.t1
MGARGREVNFWIMFGQVSACEKGLQWAKVNGLLSFNSAILALTAARRWRSALDLAHAAGERGITPQAGQELCCPQDDRHHTLRRDFGKFDEKRFSEFRNFLVAENERNRSGGSRQTDFFRLVYRQLKAVSAFPIQENLSAAILAASEAQAALKQPNLSDRDMADGLREQELLEGGARWLCLMLKMLDRSLDVVVVRWVPGGGASPVPSEEAGDGKGQVEREALQQGPEVLHRTSAGETQLADVRKHVGRRFGRPQRIVAPACGHEDEGRVLILEGLEKAERNVLPVLNNLLENREMQLEDGRFLVAPQRYDRLVKEGKDTTQLNLASAAGMELRAMAQAAPCYPCDEQLLSCARLLQQQPALPVREAIRRIFPFQTESGLLNTTVAKLVAEILPPEPGSSTSGAGTPIQPGEVHGVLPGFQQRLLEEMLLSAACGQDLCLIGPKGEGKTFLAQQLASPDSLKDREVTLYDGLRFLSPWRQQHLAQRSSAATSRADVRVTHPKFRVLALATPQRHAKGWLSNEILQLFHFFTLPRRAELLPVVSASVPHCPRAVAERLLQLRTSLLTASQDSSSPLWSGSSPMDLQGAMTPTVMLSLRSLLRHALRPGAGHRRVRQGAHRGLGGAFRPKGRSKVSEAELVGRWRVLEGRWLRRQDGEMILVDGRRFLRDGRPEDADAVGIHPKFQVVALANRPGFPFLGNDFFREMGDCFACHAIQNPDETSEVAMLRSYAPSVPLDLLRLLSSCFGELRQMVEAGKLSYPYSTRDLVPEPLGGFLCTYDWHHEALLRLWPRQGRAEALRLMLPVGASCAGRLKELPVLVFFGGQEVVLVATEGVQVARLRVIWEYPRLEAPAQLLAQLTGEEVNMELTHKMVHCWHHASQSLISIFSIPGSSPLRARFGMVLLEALDLSSGHLRRLVLGKVPGLGLKSRTHSGPGTDGSLATQGLLLTQRNPERGRVERLEMPECIACCELEAGREKASEVNKVEKMKMELKDFDHAKYDELFKAVEKEILQLRVVLQSIEARERERTWLRGKVVGEFDDNKIVDLAIGEKNVFKRRGQREDRSLIQSLLKRLSFVVDVSGSMAVFNGDGRLDRLCATMVMIMESLCGLEHKYIYEIIGHSGESEPGHDADDYFVFLISDANLRGYGISAEDLAMALTGEVKVNAHAIFIAEPDAAEEMRRCMPQGHAHLVMETSGVAAWWAKHAFATEEYLRACRPGHLQQQALDSSVAVNSSVAAKRVQALLEGDFSELLGREERTSRRKAPKNLVEFRQSPYVDGYWQPGDEEEATGTARVWLGDTDENIFQSSSLPDYWKGQKLFKPDKDCGTRRHRKPDGRKSAD